MKYNKLIIELRSVFNKFDPIGIQEDENFDEYNPEIKAILSKTRKGMNMVQLQELIYNVFVSWFDEETAGNKEEYENLTREVYEHFKNHNII